MSIEDVNNEAKQMSNGKVADVKWTRPQTYKCISTVMDQAMFSRKLAHELD